MGEGNTTWMDRDGEQPQNDKQTKLTQGKSQGMNGEREREEERGINDKGKDYKEQTSSTDPLGLLPPGGPRRTLQHFLLESSNRFVLVI